MSTRLHGPSSPVAAVIALLVRASPLVLGVDATAWWVVAVGGPVVAGVALLPFAGRPRHIGAGLLAGALTYPLVIVMLVVVAAVADLGT
ncbi:hypothetical protein [Aeromicrobium chenweiae]|uniref:Uncharacterized protein n=1 Tax=Aeromicrobium chenweiae TaxID=2079793 RepID=A0A2S0WIR4_9ACTN|nr:hypothetical protein [Aeromicrobium chenweiae]AWB91225.1 hypothetical protein C3E78_02745 [Aeromicrobium chenweiae]TGN31743.1 hypothetical protein E4L97_12245 [Aeromicrobium chenweiae]